MKSEDQLMLLPGPTPVPTNILRAMSQPMVNHRGTEFKEILEYCTEGVKKVYQTKNDLIIYPSAGSGGLEAAVVNFISPGDKVLAITIGVFGDRFAKIAAEFGADVTRLDFEWGKKADPEVVRQAIAADAEKKYKAILVTHNETSTGVVNDIKAIRDAIGDHPAMVLVDAVSGLGAMDLKTDQWNLDVVVSGSQKAFMIPPGLSFMSISPKALKAAASCTNRKFYWDVDAALKYLKKGQTPYTPAITMFYGLQEALTMMLDEGLEQVINRHRFSRDLIRAGVKGMGLTPFVADDAASCSVTSVLAPEGFSANKIRKHLQQRFNVVIAGGQQNLDDVIFRIGHLGYVPQLDLLKALAGLEIALYEMGVPVKLGAGLQKAQEMMIQKEEK